MDLDKIITKLHPLERLVLPFLKENKALPSIIKSAKLQEIEVSIDILPNYGCEKLRKIENLRKLGKMYQRTIESISDGF